MSKIFETTSRDLEQYFFMNGIRFFRYYKNDSFQTVWQYERTPWLEDVLDMYGRYLEHKKSRRCA